MPANLGLAIIPGKTPDEFLTQFFILIVRCLRQLWCRLLKTRRSSNQALPSPPPRTAGHLPAAYPAKHAYKEDLLGFSQSLIRAIAAVDMGQAQGTSTSSSPHAWEGTWSGRLP